MWPMLTVYHSAFATSTLTVAQTCEQVDNTTGLDCGIYTFAGCGFPSDPQGIYVYLPSDSAIHGAGLGEHCFGVAGGVTGVTTPSFYATHRAKAGSSNPSPNNDPNFDAQCSVSVHEIFELLTDMDTFSGWTCANANVGPEIGDLCALQFVGGPWLGTTAFGPYSLVIGSNVYAIQGIWQPGTLNGCFTQIPDTSKVGSFRGPSGCPAPNGFQLAITSDGWCTIPTCYDGQQDGFETDVDCGGSCPGYFVGADISPPGNGGCLTGKKCIYNWDCHNLVCNAGVCN